MNQQPADLPRFVQIIGRYRSLVGILAVLGLLVGVVLAALNPPLYTSRALVLYQPACPAGSICGGPEFAQSGSRVGSLPPGATQVLPRPGTTLTVSAAGQTAAQAEAAADAAARSLADARASSYPSEQVSGLLVEPATTAIQAPQRLFGDALLGAVLGALLGIMAALAGSRTTIDPMTAPRGFGAGEEDKATGRAGGYAPTGVWLADLARESVERRTALDASLGGYRADPP